MIRLSVWSIADEKSVRLIGDAEILFAKAVLVFLRAIADLCSGEIRLSTLDILLENQKILLELFNLLDKCMEIFKDFPQPVGEDKSKTGVVKKLLMWRNEEKQNFLLCRKRLHKLTTYCSTLQNGKQIIKLKYAPSQFFISIKL